MSVDHIAKRHYQDKVNKAAKALEFTIRPKEGWIRTTRKALGMSAAQLARRLGNTRALISNTEKAELEGGVTLKTMKRMAEGMNCHFVYAIVPEESVEKAVHDQIQKFIKKIQNESGKHMALENQEVLNSYVENAADELKSNIQDRLKSIIWEKEK